MKKELFIPALISVSLFLSFTQTPSGSSSISQEQTVELATIKIKSCETGTTYYYQQGQVTLTYFEEQYLIPVPKNDSLIFETYIQKLAQGPTQEFLMTMTDDGFSFKVHIKKGGREKRIFVSNAYDKQLDNLCTLFNKYYERLNLVYFEYNNIGYSDNTDYSELSNWDYFSVKTLTSDSVYVNSLTAKHKAFLLDVFCN